MPLKVVRGGDTIHCQRYLGLMGDLFLARDPGFKCCCSTLEWR